MSTARVKVCARRRGHPRGAGPRSCTRRVHAQQAAVWLCSCAVPMVQSLHRACVAACVMALCRCPGESRVNVVASCPCLCRVCGAHAALSLCIAPLPHHVWQYPMKLARRCVTLLLPQMSPSCSYQPSWVRPRAWPRVALLVLTRVHTYTPTSHVCHATERAYDWLSLLLPGGWGSWTRPVFFMKVRTGCHTGLHGHVTRPPPWSHLAHTGFGCAHRLVSS